MRKLTLSILLFCSLLANAQIDYFTMVGSDGNLIGAGVHVAPNNPYGHKNPWIIYLHGIDHRRSHPANANDTTRIAVIANKGTPKLVKTAPMPMFHKPGGDDEAWYYWNVAFYQADSDDNQWKADGLIKLIAYIRANYGSTTDTSLIVLVGYSLGGGGVFSMTRITGVKEYVKLVIPVAGGYNNTPDYPTISSWAINALVFATAGDQLAPISISDNWVNGIKAQNPQVVPNYIRLKDVSADNSPTDHDWMVQNIIEDTTSGDEYEMTNGDTWTKEETIYEYSLRFFGPRRRHSVIWFLPLLIPIRRKEENKHAA